MSNGVIPQGTGELTARGIILSGSTMTDRWDVLVGSPQYVTNWSHPRITVIEDEHEHPFQFSRFYGKPRVDGFPGGLVVQLSPNRQSTNQLSGHRGAEGPYRVRQNAELAVKLAALGIGFIAWHAGDERLPGEEELQKARDLLAATPPVADEPMRDEPMRVAMQRAEEEKTESTDRGRAAGVFAGGERGVGSALEMYRGRVKPTSTYI